MLLPGGHRRLHPANVTRFRHRYTAMQAAWRAGTVDGASVRQSVHSWVAHARHADTAQLRHTLFRGGWFDPQWSNGQPVKPASP